MMPAYRQTGNSPRRFGARFIIKFHVNYKAIKVEIFLLVTE